jgi:hypothetical protein
MAARVFADPEPFIQRKAATGRLVIPTLIVTAVSVAMSLQAAAVYLALGPAVSEVINAVILLGGYYFLEGFLIWLAFSFALYVLALAAGGHPLFGHITRIVGWGMAPLVGTGLVWTAGRYYALRDATPPELAINSRIEHETNGLAEFMRHAAGEPAFVAAMVVGGLFLVVSGYLWTLGLTKAGDLSKGRAAVVSAIPLLVFFGWRFLNSAV